MDAKMYKAYVNKVYSAVENMAKSFIKSFNTINHSRIFQNEVTHIYFLEYWLPKKNNKPKKNVSRCILFALCIYAGLLL